MTGTLEGDDRTIWTGKGSSTTEMVVVSTRTRPSTATTRH